MVTRKSERPAHEALRVRVRPPRAADARAFLAAVAASRRLHASWIAPPSTRGAFLLYARRYGGTGDASHAGFLAVRTADDALVGAFNFSQIIRGALQGAFLGYYGFAPTAGQGLMTEGFVGALDIAFRTLRLHRVEVNIQPDNARSLALAERVGFEREGYSRRYVKVAGRWRDHVRFAMLAEDWPGRRSDVLALVKERRGDDA